jgi:hypothetical protein
MLSLNPLVLGFKALTGKAKLALIGIFLAMMVVTHGSAWFVGYQKGKNISVVAIANYEKSKNKLQADVNKGQGKVNEKTITVYRDRVQVVHDVVYKNRDIIRDNVVSRDSTFSMGWINAHNAAALGFPVNPEAAANKTPSGVKDADALITVAGNYGAAHQCQAQLQGWQNWYADTKKMYEDFAKGKKPKENK